MSQEDKIRRTEAIQGIARVIAHDPNEDDALRQRARDMCVSAHTTLQQLQGGGE